MRLLILILFIIALSGCTASVLYVPGGPVVIHVNSEAGFKLSSTPVPGVTPTATSQPTEDPTPTQPVFSPTPQPQVCNAQPFPVNMRVEPNIQSSVARQLDVDECIERLSKQRVEGYIWYWVCEGGLDVPGYCIATYYIREDVVFEN